MGEGPKKQHISAGLLAHVDAGKTTLSEALLYVSGTRRTLGRVDHQDAYLDTHALERSRGIPIFSKLARFSSTNRDITLVDTPGHVDFAAEAERIMSILDCAILVINGTDGVQSHTLTLWQLLERYSVPTFLFVNKMDLPGADKNKLLVQLQQQLSAGILDFSAQAEELAENAAVCDEALLEQYLSSGTVTAGNLRGLISKRRIFPCWFGSALKLEGVKEFLELIDTYAPENQWGQEFAARVYKISRDPQGNRLTWLRLTGGHLKVRQSLSYRNHRDDVLNEKINQIRLYSGDQFSTPEEIGPGVCCAVTGLSGTFAGQAIGAQPPILPPFTEPVMTFRLELPSDCDARVFLPKLRQLEEEDPQLHVLWEDRTQQIFVQLMGKVQLEILQSLILDRFGVRVSFGTGKVTYKETITKTVEGVGHFEPLRHYAEVHLLLEPGEPGSGLVLSTACPTDVLDRNYQTLILTHLAEKQHLGVLTGSPITDLKITLMSGRAHLKHTEGGDFRQATYRAVRQGLMQAGCSLLEPWYEFTLTVPTAQIGRAITDIRAMNGQFDPPETRADNSILKGSVPVSQVDDYAVTVASYTHGTGIFQTRLAGFAPCHNPQAVIDAAQYDPQADLENTPDSVFCSHGAGFTVKWDKVPEYMHLSSVLEKSAAPEIVTSRLRTDDMELEKIMLREFGPIRRKQYTPPANRPASDKMPIAAPKENLLIVDGYNVLFASPELEEMAKLDLGLARDRLAQLLDNFAAFKKWQLILVFDGYKAKGNPGQKTPFNNIQLVYTKEGQTGDAYIEALAARIGSNYTARVVTSDSLVQLSSFRSGLLRMSARELWEEVERTQGQISALLADLRQKENRKFNQKEVSKCTKSKKKST